jgi:hypothetical protein
MQSGILALPSQLAFESISRHRFSVAPNVQWARTMIRGICAARSDRFAPLERMCRKWPMFACDAIAVDWQPAAPSGRPLIKTRRRIAAAQARRNTCENNCTLNTRCQLCSFAGLIRSCGHCGESTPSFAMRHQPSLPAPGDAFEQRLKIGLPQ